MASCGRFRCTTRTSSAPGAWCPHCRRSSCRSRRCRSGLQCVSVLSALRAAVLAATAAVRGCVVRLATTTAAATTAAVDFHCEIELGVGKCRWAVYDYDGEGELHEEVDGGLSFNIPSLDWKTKEADEWIIG